MHFQWRCYIRFYDLWDHRTPYIRVALRGWYACKLKERIFDLIFRCCCCVSCRLTVRACGHHHRITAAFILYYILYIRKMYIYTTASYSSLTRCAPDGHNHNQATAVTVALLSTRTVIVVEKWLLLLLFSNGCINFLLKRKKSIYLK